MSGLARAPKGGAKTVLALLALAACALCPAVASAADTPLLRQSAACLEATDVPACLLRALAPNRFSNLIQDADLLAHPSLLRDAGVSIEAEQSALPDSLTAYVILDAVQRAERRLPPDAVLEPIRQLPLARVKYWDEKEAAPSPRLMAYRDFWPVVKAGLGGASNGDLKQKLLEVWGADLAAKEIGRAHASDVGYIEMSPAEAQALTRFVQQKRPPDPASTRVAILIDESQFDQALLTLQEASITRDREALQGWNQERLASATLISGILFGAMPDGEDNGALLAERMLAGAALRLTEEAQKADRADIARAAADYAFRKAPEGAAFAFSMSPAVFTSASPEVAEQWLNKATREAPTADWRYIDTILRGWRAIGREDRAREVYAAALPAALARADDPAPYANRTLAARLGSYLMSIGQIEDARRLLGRDYEALIRADLEAGRTPKSIEGYLAEHADPAERAKILRACSEVSAPRRDIVLARWCLDRWPLDARLSAPRLHALRAAIGLAGGRADRDLSTARGLMRFALSELAAASLEAEGEWEPSTHALLAYAKAELRADGRLPSLPAEKLRDGYASKKRNQPTQP